MNFVKLLKAPADEALRFMSQPVIAFKKKESGCIGTEKNPEVWLSGFIKKALDNVYAFLVFMTPVILLAALLLHKQMEVLFQSLVLSYPTFNGINQVQMSINFWAVVLLDAVVYLSFCVSAKLRKTV